MDQGSLGLLLIDATDLTHAIRRVADGDAVDADLVVVGVGVVPVTEWLEGSGLRIDNGSPREALRNRLETLAFCPRSYVKKPSPRPAAAAKPAPSARKNLEWF